MGIPALLANGELFPGEHQVSLDEVEAIGIIIVKLGD